MDMQPAGFTCQLAGSWQCTMAALNANTVVWITNEGIDTGFYEVTIPGHAPIDLADGLGFIPAVYHDGADGPPLVIFHHPQADATGYVLEPLSGRFYRAGGAQ